MTTKQTVLLMQPFYGSPYLEVCDPESAEPSYWSEKLSAMAVRLEERASNIRARGNRSPRARKKARLLEEVEFYRQAAESIDGRIQRTASGALWILLGRVAP